MRIARRPGLTNAGAVVIVIFILAAAYIYLITTGAVAPPALNQQGQHTSSTGGQSLPLAVAATDQFGGTDGNTGTITVYSSSGAKLASDSLSSGVVTFSGLYVTPGQVLTLKWASDGSGELMYFPNVVVPSSSSVQSSSTVYTIPISAFTVGSFSVAISDQSNNAYSTGGCFNVTAGTGAQCSGGSTAAKPGASPSNLYLTVANSQSNSGYISSFDPIDGFQDSALLVISGAGAASFQGCSQTFTRSSTFYCVMPLTNSQLVCQTIGQTLQCGSSRSSLTIQAGTIAHGSSETETLTVYLNANANNFQSTGSWGPDAVSAASATIKIAK
jgi:hypothetical protein